MLFCSRVSRSPRRSRSTHNVSPTCSPEPVSPAAEGSSDAASRAQGTTSPKRSQSSVGGAKGLSAHKRRSKTANASRSSSLPRAPPLSPQHSLDEPRTNKRPQKPLPTARSVADMTAACDEEGEEDGCCHAASSPMLAEVASWDSQPLGGSASEANILDSSAQSAEEQHNKKKSLKSSIKNMFTFKKRYGVVP